jgi:hypothetical protein
MATSLSGKARQILPRWFFHAPPDQQPADLKASAEFAGHFLVSGHRLRLHTQYWSGPPLHSEPYRSWLGKIGKPAFFHVQQAGSKPTFIGVACDEVELGRRFALELLCGGWGWHSLRLRHVLFTVNTMSVQAYEGSSCRSDPALAELATGHVLPRARDQVARQSAEDRERAAALAGLADGPWLSSLYRAAAFDGESSPIAVSHHAGKSVVVSGSIDVEEGRALACALAKGTLWSPTQQGHLHLHLGTAGIELATELASRDSGARIVDFANRFCRYVIVSDLHLGLSSRDTFGRPKADLLVALLRRVARDRSTLVFNGDFLELLHERYGAIERSYPEIFAWLPRVRRLLYVAGNHDDEILRENTKLTRRSTRLGASQQAFAKVQFGAPGELELAPVRRNTTPHRAADWMRYLSNPQLRPTLEEILLRRQGTVWLSRGFAKEGIAFQRLGPRDTDAEGPQWYLDESLLDHPARVPHLLKLLSDRRQRLDKVLQQAWGDGLQILRYHWDSARGVYCEHGHFAIPECHGNRLGKAVSTAAGWTKRIGLRQIEHWFEEHLGSWMRAVHPFDTLRELHFFSERQLAVATVLLRLGGGLRRPTIICSHTHEPAIVGTGPIHAFVHQATGATYANTGAWSSRFRLKRSGNTRVEWLEVSAANRVRPRVATII